MSLAHNGTSSDRRATDCLRKTGAPQRAMAQNRAPHLTIVCLASLALGTIGCDAERSSNPLSPQIAGPIAGVTISTPGVIEPPNGLLIASTAQPITLRFANVTSNSVRPFTYEIEVATDPVFAPTLLTVTDVAPGETGTVVVTLTQTLDAEQVYYWRVRAVDGANAGIYSEIASFEVFTAVVIAAPVAGVPSGGQITSSNSPMLLAHHADISGPAEAVMYRFELATEPGFANPTTILTVVPDNGPSTAVSSGGLPYDTTFHWRVRASAQARNGPVLGPWSNTASFRTPPASIIIGTPIPVTPANGQTVASVQPTLTATNGTVTGAAATVVYRFEVDEGTSFGNPAALVEVPRSGGDTTSATVTANLESDREYFWRVHASNGTTTSAWSAPQRFRTPPGGSPPPPPGEQPPLPNEEALIVQLAATNPDALADSCIEEGGSWEFMDLAVTALRAKDTRWGYNCKRGDCSDPSIDVVDYFWGNGEAQGSTNVYLVDIISAVCPGGAQSPAWIDQTQTTLDEGTVGRWIYPRP